MPLGIQRLNARHQQPNTRITFIKPLPGSTSAYAQDFLERIAAICHPIMKSNYLSITTLEEYEPNPEFVGRNFNAGEIIQLVLRARDGSWLSFRSVQMVMVHELAHCKEMNHGRGFWKVRNDYAGELRGLWGKGYTGDGFWGRGKTVLSEQYENTAPTAPEMMPTGLCGGTFRSRRKRKRKGAGAGEKPDWRQQKERRIAKKFGTNGMALGADEETKVKLEDGKKVKAKPRVAGSARGRELRAAAALARFGVQKEEETTKEEEKLESGSETDDEEYDAAEEGNEATNLDGSRMLDGKGQGMVRICEDEDQNDADVKQETRELQELEHLDLNGHEIDGASNGASYNSDEHAEEPLLEPDGRKARQTSLPITPPTPNQPVTDPENKLNENEEAQLSASKFAPPTKPNNEEADAETSGSQTQNQSCPICSMANEPSATTCVICSHVLDTSKVPGFWRCSSSTCADSQYINVTDSALCGVCGARRPD